MTEGTFADGYRDGWGSVAGLRPAPECTTCPPLREWDGKNPFQIGFEYGRADALELFQPDH